MKYLIILAIVILTSCSKTGYIDYITEEEVGFNIGGDIVVILNPINKDSAQDGDFVKYRGRKIIKILKKF